MKTIKRWLSGMVTGLLVIVLFGIIFVKLELVTLTDSFFLELGIVAVLTTIIRIMWYNEGEDKALQESDIKEMKVDYSTLVDAKITSQKSLDLFVDDLNAVNRRNWVLYKLKGRTEKTCPKYSQIKQKLIEKSYKKVPKITSTQILTRSQNYESVDAKDYTKFKKTFYQISSVVISMGSTILLGSIAYKELLMNWTNIFRYMTYIFSIVWALASSFLSGYKTYRTNTIDHISRLTMIVHRYEEWCKNGGINKCEEAARQATI